MILKNFYITKGTNKDLKYVSKILGQSEGKTIRELLEKHLKRFYPKILNNVGFYPNKIRQYLFKKYQYKCAYCGKKNSLRKNRIYDYEKKKERYSNSFSTLEVHHKDKNPKNNLLSNLIILCKNCHKKEDCRKKLK